MIKQEFKTTNRLCPQELFRVSKEVCYLDADQIGMLEKAFADWELCARRAESVRSRRRMRLTFLLLRHTGARLGEILSIDDGTAFDAMRSTVCLGTGGASREVPIPEAFCSQVIEVLNSPMGCGLQGSFFHIDPGYFRRTCYARGKECGLPKNMVNPRVLRNTRAVEMLRGGVPLAVVKEILGQISLDIVAGLQKFTKGDMTSIVRLAQDDMRQRTSARNSFMGHVIRVLTDVVMAEVVMQTQAGGELCAVITMDSLRSLKIEVGSPVVATVKAPLVNVARCGAVGPGSARNRLGAKVRRIIDSPVISEITGEMVDGTELCALVSGKSVRDMNLKAGDEAEFWFKGLSVVLNTVQP